MEQRDMTGISVMRAQIADVKAVKALADKHRKELGFIRHAALEQAAREDRLLVAKAAGDIIGFIHFRPCRDGHVTIYEIAIIPEWQGRGVGRSLIEAVVDEARQCGCTVLRLRCPVDLPANGFYSRLGFVRVRVEKGKRRPLAVWERKISLEDAVDSPIFFITLTHHATEIRDIIRLWDESGDPRDPFAHVIFTPLFSSSSTVRLIRQLKDERGSEVMFDSGGYQVQMGRATYEELFDRLLRFYRENDWADWYVLPDHVPLSTDTDREVEFKVRETIEFARLFLREMGDGFAEKTIGVVHGRNGEQIRRCVEAYSEMGVRYLGFGSFGTSGPSGTVNLISRKSLSLLSLLQRLIREDNLRLHIFGIGSPSHLIRLADADIMPTSFDSAGWWKAGGFGKVFFPTGQQLHITIIDRYSATLNGVIHEKQRTQHDCPFCTDISRLRRSRIMRVMHNLVAMLETIERVKDYENKSGDISHSTQCDTQSVEDHPRELL